MLNFVVIQGIGKVRQALVMGYLECSDMKFGLNSVGNRELFKVSKQEHTTILMI